MGRSLRLFVYNTDPQAPGALKTLGERVVANPKIVEYSAETEVGAEGCLSLRAECCRGDVRRASWVAVEYQDEVGAVQRKQLRGFEAVVFQNQYDKLQVHTRVEQPRTHTHTHTHTTRARAPPARGQHPTPHAPAC